ncbi:hypothetical protein [Paenibacillus polymyxa]|uniref:hypothetical protein n=1 Tax=Paenibacillus polymyxa TaxID=1406 RepID=UPI0003D31E0E|nr:hypothetical protein [Paenibacillus polymyxa]AHC22685.1 hypothetical protein X809_06285 [Paenibacillus polymyxa CR1]
MDKKIRGSVEFTNGKKIIVKDNEIYLIEADGLGSAAPIDSMFILDLIVKLKEQIEIKDKALEFYAAEKTYLLQVSISMGSAHARHEPIKYDKGERARAALKGEDTP